MRPRTRIRTGLAIAAVAALASWALLHGPEHTPGGDGAREGPRAAGRAAELARLPEPRAEDDRTAAATDAPPGEARPDAGAAAYIGVVTDRGGAPIEGALLRVAPKRNGSEIEPEAIAEGRSGPAGRFSLACPPGLDRERYLVIYASADGYQSMSMDPVLPGSEIEISLTPTGTFRGRIVEEGTDHPIAGAEVLVGLPDVAAVSGPDGRFELPDQPVDRPVSIRLRHADFASESTSAPMGGALAGREREEVVLTMQRGNELRLRIVDEASGATLPGATVSERSSRAAWSADERGEVRLRLPARGRLALAIEAEGYATLTLGGAIAEGEPGAVTDLPMRGLAYVEGTLTDESGGAIEGARLWAEPDGGRPFAHGIRVAADPEERPGLPSGGWYTAPEDAIEPTDDAGRFVIPVVPGDVEYRVKGGSRELVSVDEGPLRVTEPGQRVPLDIVQRGGATIRGGATFNGEPLARALVVATHSDGATTAARVRADGVYELTGVPAGAQTVSLLQTQGAVGPQDPVELEAVAGRTHVVDFIILDELVPIAGRVVDAAGEPAAELFVHAARGSGGERVSFSARTDDHGAFELRVPRGGPYFITAGRGAERTTVADVPPGAEGVVVQLAAVTRVALRVVDAETGRPVPQVVARSRAIGWCESGSTRHRRAEDLREEGGRVEFSVPYDAGAAGIDVFLDLRAAGYAQETVEGIALAAPGAEPGTVEVRLVRGLDCRFRLSDPGAREALDGALVFVLAEGEDASVRGPFPDGSGESNHRINGAMMWLERRELTSRLLHFDGTGRGEIERLRPGAYSIRAFPDDVRFEPATFELVEDGQLVELKVVEGR